METMLPWLEPRKSSRVDANGRPITELYLDLPKPLGKFLRAMRQLRSTPHWKVQRELQRMRRQLAGPFLPAYDRVRGAIGAKIGRRMTKRHAGALAVGPEIALYIIFPQGGCVPSHFQALDHLIAKGFTPLVVSNVPISSEDRAELCKRAYLVVERPNIGYDFGGYWEGITILNEREIVPETLLVLNDSIWFPIRENCDLLDRMRNVPEGYVGASDNYYYGRRGLQEKKLDGRLHVASYLFLVRREVFQSEAFQDYWRTYRLCSLKADVVKAGEVGVFETLTNAGIAHRIIFEKNAVAAQLAQVDSAAISHVLERLIGLTPHAYETWQELVREHFSGAGDPEVERAFVLDEVEKVNTSDVLAYVGIVRFGFPFLKKSILRGGHYQAARFLYYMDKDGTRIDPQVEAEIRALANSRRH